MKKRSIPFRPTTIYLTAVAFGALFIVACATPYQWTTYPDDAALDALVPDDWRYDVTYLREELPARNPHFREDPTMAGVFDRQAEKLIGQIDESTSYDEMIAGISRLLALVGEGHTSLNSSPSVYFPVIVRWLAEGLFIAGADRAYVDLIGAEVVGLRLPDGSDLSVSELEPLLNEVICVDHPNGYRPSHAQVLSDPYLMRGLSLADADGLRYLVELDGVVEAHLVVAAPGEDLDIVRIYDDAAELPASQTEGPGNWYVRTGPDNRTVYVSYDDCTLDAFGFFREVLAELRGDDVDRLVIDLRQNSGGNSLAGSWFSRRLGGIEKFREPGSLYVLIGPNTFSSGMMIAVDLMERTTAVFAGEPLAESADSWGEVKRFPLPRSGLMIGHSTKFFAYSKGKDLRLDDDGILVPDDGYHLVPTFGAYAAGRDPVLEFVIP